MSSPEDKAYEIMRELDVSYVLVIFGGLTGYASDGELQLSLILLFIASHIKLYCCWIYRHQQVSLDGSYWR